MHVQPRASQIADALDQFAQRWHNGETVEANLAGAYEDLAAALAAFDIRYGQNTESVQANPTVDNLQIRELVDMLRTLFVCAAAEPGAFLPGKFWSKLLSMALILREAANAGSDGSGNEFIDLAKRNAELNRAQAYALSDSDGGPGEYGSGYGYDYGYHSNDSTEAQYGSDDSTQAQYGSDDSHSSLSYGSDQGEGYYGSEDRDPVAYTDGGYDSEGGYGSDTGYGSDSRDHVGYGGYGSGGDEGTTDSEEQGGYEHRLRRTGG